MYSVRGFCLRFACPGESFEPLYLKLCVPNDFIPFLLNTLYVRLVSNYLKPLNKIENLEFSDTAKTYLLILSVKLIFHSNYVLFVSRG